MKQIKAAIVGLGKVAWGYPPSVRQGRASTHWQTYQIAGLDCVAGVDAQDEAAEKFSATTGLPVYKDLSLLLEKHSIDVVSICSPDAFHAEALRVALEHGIKRVWLEKPPASTLKEAQEMHMHAENKNARVVVNFFRRYHPSFVRMREILMNQELGALKLVRLQYSRGLLTNGIHQLDLLHFLTGDRLNFVVEHATFVQDEKHVDATLRSGDLRVQIAGTPLDYNIQEIEVLCENGRATAVQGGGIVTVEVSIPHPDYPGFKKLDTKECLEDPSPGDCFPSVLKDVLSDVRPVSDLKTACRSMELFEKIMEAAHANSRSRR